jgi:3'(2'), 5'-bisphosphate nucleotidase
MLPALGERVREVVAIALDAGGVILEVYQRPGGTGVSYKADRSPLTEADMRSHELIATSLAHRFPGIPIVSEEGDAALVPDETVCWVVDPLDGTKEFVKRTGEFTVNIALVSCGEPVLGVVHAPVSGHTWYTAPDGAWISGPTGTTTLQTGTPAYHVAGWGSATARAEQTSGVQSCRPGRKHPAGRRGGPPLL